MKFYEKYIFKNTLIHHAINYENIDTVKVLLSHPKINANATYILIAIF